MTNPRTLKELIKKNDDELSFGGYTEDMLQECAKRLIAGWKKELRYSMVDPRIRGKIEAFKEFFDV